MRITSTCILWYYLCQSKNGPDKGPCTSLESNLQLVLQVWVILSWGIFYSKQFHINSNKDSSFTQTSQKTGTMRAQSVKVASQGTRNHVSMRQVLIFWAICTYIYIYKKTLQAHHAKQSYLPLKITNYVCCVGIAELRSSSNKSTPPSPPPDVHGDHLVPRFTYNKTLVFPSADILNCGMGWQRLTNTVDDNLGAKIRLWVLT